jgi:SAM-dependent methyltransferase
MYIEEDDPWRVGSSWYEQRKIAVLLASLAEPRYRRALDPACGTAHLARALSRRCDEVVGYDASAPAIDVARRTCGGLENVTLGVRALPYDPPDTPGAPFDLIVLSEFLYYLDAPRRRAALTSVLERAAGRVEIASVHWRERPDDGTASGDEVHEELRAELRPRGFRHQVAHFDEEFVIDILTLGHDRHSE